MRLILAIGALLLLACTDPVLAQNGPPVAFGQVTGIPIPLQSVSGRFSSLNPLDRHGCADKKVSGRVVSPTLILVPQSACGRREQTYVLVNVQLANPADAVQMVPGRRVDITASFKRALEARDLHFYRRFCDRREGRDCRGRSDRSFRAARASLYELYDLPAAGAGRARHTAWQRSLCAEHASLQISRQQVRRWRRPPARLRKCRRRTWCPAMPMRISCRLDPGVSDRHLTAIACARNSYWTWAKAIARPQILDTGPAMTGRLLP